MQVFSRRGSEGELTLATRQVPVSQSAWTTIGVLYDLTKDLGFDLDGRMHRLSERATDEVLDESYQIIAERLTQLLEACGNLTACYRSAVSGKELRAPKGHENDGHAFMRPVVQVAVVRAVRHVMQQDLLTWDEAMAKLRALDWRISSAPFIAVWRSTPESRAQGKMITSKDNSNLLLDLLRVHIAPTTKAQVDRAVRSYKDLRESRYPIPADELYANMVPASSLASASDPGSTDPVAEDSIEGPETTLCSYVIFSNEVFASSAMPSSMVGWRVAGFRLSAFRHPAVASTY